MLGLCTYGPAPFCPINSYCEDSSTSKPSVIPTAPYTTNTSNISIACLMNKKLVWQQLQTGFYDTFLFNPTDSSTAKPKSKSNEHLAFQFNLFLQAYIYINSESYSSSPSFILSLYFEIIMHTLKPFN